MNHLDSMGQDAPTPVVRADKEALRAALISAIRHQDALLVRRLLAVGANPNSRISPESKRSALHLAACARRDSGILTLLLVAGARPDARDARGNTPLIAATQAGCAWAVRQLLAAGASEDADPRRHGSRSAQLAAHEKLQTQRTHRQAEVVRMLDNGQGKLNSRQAALLNKLMTAVQHGRLPDIRRLLADGAPLNANCPKRLEAPLHLAVANGDMRVLRLLLKEGADVDLLSDYGRTPLMRAMGKGQAFVVSALLQAGADVNKRDAMGRRALDYCSDAECRHLLRSHGALRGKEDEQE